MFWISNNRYGNIRAVIFIVTITFIVTVLLVLMTRTRMMIVETFAVSIVVMHLFAHILAVFVLWYDKEEGKNIEEVEKWFDLLCVHPRLGHIDGGHMQEELSTVSHASWNGYASSNSKNNMN